MQEWERELWTARPMRRQMQRCLRRVLQTWRVPPTVLAWSGGTVVTLAQAIEAERRYGDLPILADALEEAGYDEPEPLAALRQEGYTDGSWVLDLILRPDVPLPIPPDLPPFSRERPEKAVKEGYYFI